ncbi:hypothetical protein [Streptomyces buecherae]
MEIFPVWDHRGYLLPTTKDARELALVTYRVVSLGQSPQARSRKS